MNSLCFLLLTGATGLLKRTCIHFQQGKRGNPVPFDLQTARIFQESILKGNKDSQNNINRHATKQRPHVLPAGRGTRPPGSPQR